MLLLKKSATEVLTGISFEIILLCVFGYALCSLMWHRFLFQCRGLLIRDYKCLLKRLLTIYPINPCAEIEVYVSQELVYIHVHAWAQFCFTCSCKCCFLWLNHLIHTMHETEGEQFKIMVAWACMANPLFLHCDADSH